MQISISSTLSSDLLSALIIELLSQNPCRSHVTLGVRILCLSGSGYFREPEVLRVCALLRCTDSQTDYIVDTLSVLIASEFPRWGVPVPGFKDNSEIFELPGERFSLAAWMAKQDAQQVAVVSGPSEDEERASAARTAELRRMARAATKEAQLQRSLGR